MSETNPANTAPPTPSGTVVPKRSPRVMNKLPLYAGAAVLLFVCGVGIYVIAFDSETGAVRSAEPSSALTGARPGNDMPKEGVIGPQVPPATNAGFHYDLGRDVVVPDPVQQLPAHVRPAPGMSETEIEGRRQAWTRFYQDRLQESGNRRAALASALASDATSTPTSRSGGKASGGASSAPAGGGAPPGPGTAPAPAGGPADRLQDVYGPGTQDAAGSHYLATEVTHPSYALEVKQGTNVLCSTVKGMTNELGGQVTLLVTQKVTDAETGMHTLIPEGSKIIAIYSNDQKYGDERIPAAVTRIIYPPPGNESLDIGTMPLGDQAGFIGLQDQVDRHTGRIVFNAVLNGIFGVSTSLAQQAASGAVGGNIAQFGNQISPKFLEAKPTITIRPGNACVVEMTSDIGFDHEWVPSGVPAFSPGVLPVSSR